MSTAAAPVVSNILTAQQILAIPVASPERLFAGNDADKVAHRILAKRWHPDANDGSAEATAVFQHINELFRARTEALSKGTWAGRGEVELAVKNGHPIVLRHLRRRTFELGTMYVSHKTVTYIVDASFRELFDNGIRAILGFKYSSSRMEAEIARFLPKIERQFDLVDGAKGVIFTKTPDVMSLRDLLDYEGGKLDPKHVAWIMSFSHNLACYFQWAKMTHNAVDIDSVFVSPEHHGGVLIGGWWYSKPVGERMTHLPARTAARAPRSVVSEKLANPRIDHALIKTLGRELLGDVSGGRLRLNTDVPPPMISWLTTPGSGNAFYDYEEWAKVRDKSFGERRFTKWLVTESDLYGHG